MMTKINKKSRWLLGAALITCHISLLTSCNDWLDVAPETEMDRNELVSNEAGYRDAMSGVYAAMTSENLYGQKLTWHMLELMGGGAIFGSSFDSSPSLAYFYFHPKSDYYTLTRQEMYIDPVWQEQYKAIANLNSLLETIDGQKGIFQGNDYEVFKGEALGLRAFLHFDLLRLYGEAFARDTDTPCMPYVNELTSKVFPLLTPKECCTMILKDLSEARELLRHDPIYTGETPSQYLCSTPTGGDTYRLQYNIESWHNRRFHFNYYAALGTMARVYLWMGEKANALACAKEIIDAQPTRFPWTANALVANVVSGSDYVAKDRSFTTEQIFALNIKDLEDRTDGYLHQGKYTFASGSNYSHPVGINVDATFDAATRAYDPRYAYLKNVYTVNGRDFTCCAKLLKASNSTYYSPWANERMPLMRVTEMYYIAAECEPNLDQATAYLETVRNQRGMSAFPLKVTNAEELQTEIEKEYRKEFICEGQLFFYFKRMNKSVTNGSQTSSRTITPDYFTMPRPDDEDTYGGR